MRSNFLNKSGVRRKNVKSSNDLTKLLRQMTEGRGSGLSGLVTPVKSSNIATSISSSKSPSLGSQPGVQSLALSAPTTAKSINFGSPSSSRTTGSQSGAEWTNLLRQTVTGGISSGLGGGLLSAVSGLGGLVSSFAGLFGGGMKTEAPLTRFQLPDSQNETIFASSYQTGATGARTSSNGIYAQPTSSSSQSAHDQSPQWQSAQITEAVKQALLNSSSLNDVIAEI